MEFIKWLIRLIFTYKRTSYPRTKIGGYLCLASLSAGSFFSLGIIKINFKASYFINTISFTNSEPSIIYTILSICIFLVGCILIYSELNQKTRNTAKVFISAMPNVPIEFPNNILNPSEKALCREPIRLGILQNADENIEQQIKLYNAELEVDIFKRFILHENGEKIYIGGLARVPFLVAYGAMLRNQSARIVYFDKFHRNGNYALLDDVNEQIKLRYNTLIKKVNNMGNIGIAVGFTTPICVNQLPLDLKDFTTILSPSKKTERNLIKNQDNLHQVSEEICKIIDTLSALDNCKKIHLFLSIQSSLAIEIGRRYQEGTHKNWVIYNFDPTTNSYTWALELSRTGISLISSK